MHARLIDAAFEVCDTHGVAGLTMRRLAARAGVTAPAIYRYYPGKADVLQAMVDRANRIMAGYLARVDDEPDPWTRLRGTLDALIDFALDHPRAFDVLFFSRDRRDDELMPERRQSPNFRTFLSRIDACRAAGVIRDELESMTVAITLWAHAQGLLALHLQGRFGGSAERLRALFADGIDAIADGIASGGAPKVRA